MYSTRLDRLAEILSSPRRWPRSDRSVATAASPAAGGAGGEDDPAFLFVQTFEFGTWEPKKGADGTHVLSLTGNAAQTVYLSDRPERIAGTAPTPRFLDGLGFSPINPPNAALVAQTDAGEAVQVVELMNPVYTEGPGPGEATLTYEARVLDDGVNLNHVVTGHPGTGLPDAFGPATLFIDDCPDITDCLRWGDDTRVVGPIPDGPWGMCWSWSQFDCLPCRHATAFYDGLCNEGYADECRGECFACTAANCR